MFKLTYLTVPFLVSVSTLVTLTSSTHFGHKASYSYLPPRSSSVHGGILQHHSSSRLPSGTHIFYNNNNPSWKSHQQQSYSTRRKGGISSSSSSAGSRTYSTTYKKKNGVYPASTRPLSSSHQKHGNRQYFVGGLGLSPIQNVFPNPFIPTNQVAVVSQRQQGKPYSKKEPCPTCPTFKTREYKVSGPGFRSSNDYVPSTKYSGNYPPSINNLHDPTLLPGHPMNRLAIPSVHVVTRGNLFTHNYAAYFSK